jgi:hypothetical protein
VGQILTGPRKKEENGVGLFQNFDGPIGLIF